MSHTVKPPGDDVIRREVLLVMDKYPDMSLRDLRRHIEQNRKWSVSMDQLKGHRLSWLAREKDREMERERIAQKGGLIQPKYVTIQTDDFGTLQKAMTGMNLRDPVEKQQRRAEDWALEHPFGTLADMDQAIGKLIPDLAPQFAQEALRLAKEAAESKAAVTKETPVASEAGKVVGHLNVETLEFTPQLPQGGKLGRGMRRDDRDAAVLSVLAKNPGLVPTPTDFGKDLPDVEAIRLAVIQTGYSSYPDEKTRAAVDTNEVKVSLRRLKKQGRLPARRLAHPPPEEVATAVQAKVAQNPNWGIDRPGNGDQLPTTRPGITITLPDGTTATVPTVADAAQLLAALKGGR